MTRDLFRAKAASTFIFVAVTLDSVSMGIVGPVLPSLIAQLTHSNAWAGVINGLLVSLWASIQFVASPAIGALSDRFGRRPVILVSTAGLALHYLIVALAPNLWWLALGRIIAGATSANISTIYAYIADVTAPEKRARSYGLVGAAFSGGLVAGPLLGGALAEVSPRAAFWTAGTLTAVAFLYGMFILPESLMPNRRMAFSWQRANPFGAMGLLRSHHELPGLALVNFLIYFAYHAFSVLVLYAGYRYRWSSLDVGMLVALFYLFNLIVQAALVGPAAERLGDWITMILGLLGGALGMACMGLAPTGLLFTIAVVLASSWVLATPTLQSLMTQRVSEFEQGQLQGAILSVASIAGAVSPSFFGIIYSMSVSGPSRNSAYSGAVFLIAALVLLIASISAWYVSRRVENAQARRTQTAIRQRQAGGKRAPN